MTHVLRTILAATVLSSFAGLSSACAHAHEGPMEKAGRKTDDAAHDVKEGAKEAADDVKN